MHLIDANRVFQSRAPQCLREATPTVKEVHERSICASRMTLPVLGA